MLDREHAVFRGRFEVNEEDLAAAVIEMSFGSINQDGWVYVNGQKVGESHNAESVAVFDVKRFLRPGENTVAVVVAVYGGGGGISKGVALQFQGKPELPEWKRSVFNGLAQIIVKSSKNSGTLELTAQSNGLRPATVAIQAQACMLRAAMP